MNAQPSEVHRLEASSIDEAADVIARAFFDYPIWTWFEPDPAKRRQLMDWYMRVQVRFGLLADEVFGIGEPLRGVAIWEPPAETPIDRDPDGTRSGYADLRLHMSAEAIAKSAAVGETQQPVRDRVTGGRPFWYLPWLAVDPSAQRTGAGTALLRDMFDRADATGTPICLETEKEANVAYYEQQGFRLVHHGELPMGGPDFWTFLRDPST